jgi:hypothetical protein
MLRNAQTIADDNPPVAAINIGKIFDSAALNARPALNIRPVEAAQVVK